jgi:hypothetical protein
LSAIVEESGVPRFRFYHRGLGATPALPASSTPPELADSSLLALQSHLYPRDPGVVQQMADQAGQPLPIGLPQRMMFSRWKSGGMKVYAEEAKGYVSARDFGAQHSGVLVQAAGVPPVQLSPASFATGVGATALSMQTVDPDVNRMPIARGYLPADRYVTKDELDRFVADSEASQIAAQQTRNAGASAAISQANAVRNAVFDRLGGRELPWYARR